MSDASPEILYAAHTATCTFLLDSEGICRKIAKVVLHTPAGASGPSAKRKDAAARAAARCVGAQYVASLDPTVSGMLAEMPRVGAAMLFARVDDRGRVSLVRTGAVTRFESHRDDPFEENPTNPHARPAPAMPIPSCSVETSAPVITPQVSTAPRRVRETALPPPMPVRNDSFRNEQRTQPIETVRREDFARGDRRSGLALQQPHQHENGTDNSLSGRAKSEYESQPAARGSAPTVVRPDPREARRPTWPSPGANLSPPHPTTLRQPAVPLDLLDDDDETYGLPNRSPAATALPPPPPPPRRSEPFVARMRSDRVPRPGAREPEVGATRPGSYPSIEKEPGRVAIRRRGER